jgi:hypothetical protein
MKLYEVGPKPLVSPKGVSFDTTKPDRYRFLSPALELMERLNFDVEAENTHQKIQKVKSGEYSSKKIKKGVKKYCENIEELIEDRDRVTKKLISELEERVDSSDKLSTDEKRAWLGNISSMKRYYLQYVTNETVYRCLLNRMADRFIKSNIESITFPLKKSYGLVLQDLSYILREHKPPFDAEIVVESRNGELFGKFRRI